jgi:hypothetical protein
MILTSLDRRSRMAARGDRPPKRRSPKEWGGAGERIRTNPERIWTQAKQPNESQMKNESERNPTSAQSMHMLTPAAGAVRGRYTGSGFC